MAAPTGTKSGTWDGSKCAMAAISLPEEREEAPDFPEFMMRYDPEEMLRVLPEAQRGNFLINLDGADDYEED